MRLTPTTPIEKIALPIGNPEKRLLIPLIFSCFFRNKVWIWHLVPRKHSGRLPWFHRASPSTTLDELTGTLKALPFQSRKNRSLRISFQCRRMESKTCDRSCNDRVKWLIWDQQWHAPGSSDDESDHGDSW